MLLLLASLIILSDTASIDRNMVVHLLSTCLENILVSILDHLTPRISPIACTRSV